MVHKKFKVKEEEEGVMEVVAMMSRDSSIGLETLQRRFGYEQQEI